MALQHFDVSEANHVLNVHVLESVGMPSADIGIQCRRLAVLHLRASIAVAGALIPGHAICTADQRLTRTLASWTPDHFAAVQPWTQVFKLLTTSLTA